MEPTTIYVYGALGERNLTAPQLIRELENATTREIEVRINSAGGIALDGLMFHDALARARGSGHKITCHIDGLALSAAAIIAMAGAPTIISDGGLLMFHECRRPHGGTAGELRRQLGAMDHVNDRMAAAVAAKCDRPLSEVRGWLRDTRWFTAREAVAFGLAERRDTEAPALAAMCDLSNSEYNIPAHLIDHIRSPVLAAVEDFEFDVRLATRTESYALHESTRRRAIEAAGRIERMPGHSSADLQRVCDGLNKLDAYRNAYVPRGVKV